MTKQLILSIVVLVLASLCHAQQQEEHQLRTQFTDGLVNKRRRRTTFIQVEDKASKEKSSGGLRRMTSEFGEELDQLQQELEEELEFDEADWARLLKHEYSLSYSYKSSSSKSSKSGKGGKGGSKSSKSGKGGSKSSKSGGKGMSSKKHYSSKSMHMISTRSSKGYYKSSKGYYSYASKSKSKSGKGGYYGSGYGSYASKSSKSGKGGGYGSYASKSSKSGKGSGYGSYSSSKGKGGGSKGSSGKGKGGGSKGSKSSKGYHYSSMSRLHRSY